MSERVKLQEPGSELYLHVTKVSTETVDNVEYALFSDGKQELLVPSKSVASQLERLGVATAFEMQGMWIRFSRSTKLSKYGKPFWNLDVADVTEAQPAPSKRVPSPYAPPKKPVLDMDGHEVRDESFPPLPPELAEQPAELPREAEYLALFDRVVAHMMKTEAPELLLPLANAVTFSIWGSR